MSIFSGIATATLSSWLSEAQTALHDLSVGKKTVSIGIGDKRITFSPAEVPKLKSYIGQLQVQIAINQGTAVGGPYSVATWTR